MNEEIVPEVIRINPGKGIASIKAFDIYELLPENDPKLTVPTIPFDFADPPINPVYFAMSLFETMFTHKGLGLTANQVGWPWSVFVVGVDDKNKQVFFNPKIIETSIETETAMEGCLSFPQLFFKVKRPSWINVEYQHVNGEVRQNKYSGMTARIVAHEYDHILGGTFFDHVGKTSVMMAKEKRAKLRKRLLRIT